VLETEVRGSIPGQAFETRGVLEDDPLEVTSIKLGRAFDNDSDPTETRGFAELASGALSLRREVASLSLPSAEDSGAIGCGRTAFATMPSSFCPWVQAANSVAFSATMGASVSPNSFCRASLRATC